MVHGQRRGPWPLPLISSFNFHPGSVRVVSFGLVHAVYGLSLPSLSTLDGAFPRGMTVFVSEPFGILSFDCNGTLTQNGIRAHLRHVAAVQGNNLIPGVNAVCNRNAVRDWTALFDLFHERCHHLQQSGRHDYDVDPGRFVPRSTVVRDGVLAPSLRTGILLFAFTLHLARNSTPSPHPNRACPRRPQQISRPSSKYSPREDSCRRRRS